jgi:hypothetical protein
MVLSSRPIGAPVPPVIINEGAQKIRHEEISCQGRRDDLSIRLGGSSYSLISLELQVVLR